MSMSMKNIAKIAAIALVAVVVAKRTPYVKDYV